MVTGGQVTLQYGIPRFTQAIDLTVALTPEDSPSVVSAIEDRVLPNDMERFVKQTWVLPLQHKGTKVRVDVIFSATQLERKAIKRARKIQMEDTTINYIPPEGLVVQKLIAGRPKDLEDAKGILKVQGEGINRDRIERLIRSLAQETGEMEWLSRWKALK